MRGLSAAAAAVAAPADGSIAGSPSSKPAAGPPPAEAGYLTPTDASSVRTADGRQRRALLDALNGAVRATVTRSAAAGTAAVGLAVDSPADTALSRKLAAAGVVRVDRKRPPSSSGALDVDDASAAPIASPPRKPPVPALGRRRASAAAAPLGAAALNTNAPLLAVNAAVELESSLEPSSHRYRDTAAFDCNSIDGIRKNSAPVDSSEFEFSASSSGSAPSARFGSFLVAPPVVRWSARDGDCGPVAVDHVVIVRNVDIRGGNLRQLQVGLPCSTSSSSPSATGSSEACPFSVAAVSWPGDAPAAAGYRGARYTSLLPPGLPLRVTVRYTPPPAGLPTAPAPPASALLRLRVDDGSEFCVRLLAPPPAAAPTEAGDADDGCDASDAGGAGAGSDLADAASTDDTSPAPSTADADAVPTTLATSGGGSATAADPLAPTADAPPATADGRVGDEPDTAPAAPSIVCEPPAVAFGAVPLLTVATRTVTLRNTGAVAVRLRAVVAPADGPPLLPLLPPSPLLRPPSPVPPPTASLPAAGGEPLAAGATLSNWQRRRRKGSAGTEAPAAAAAAAGATRGARLGFRAAVALLSDSAAPAAAPPPLADAAAVDDGVRVTVSPSAAVVVPPGATVTLTLTASASVPGTYRQLLALQADPPVDGADGGGERAAPPLPPAPVAAVPVTLRAVGSCLHLRPGSVGLRLPSVTPTSHADAAPADYGRLDFGGVTPGGPPVRRTVTVVNTAPLPAQLTWRVAPGGSDGGDDDGTDSDAVPVVVAVTVVGGEDDASGQAADCDGAGDVGVAVSVRVEPTHEEAAPAADATVSGNAGVVFAVASPSPPTAWIPPGGHAAVTVTAAAAPGGGAGAGQGPHALATAALVGDVTWWRRGTRGAGAGGGAVVSRERGAVVLAARACLCAPAGGEEAGK